ncbi:dehydrogenase/reductase SDR family member 11-like [Oppia nitens]|uniref:dehydrogenase/reductase SDR family member 11-like n=1 Tax=Oppia nitens TaxID=1686743 RepID=UPI0023DB92C8|nr:dehydrogenase/reductase SDR family member 11-like [Oppia nitens]XP_054153090.1 dehydrogenase/reductase SDR family member 11-like [Oppia nitens]
MDRWIGRVALVTGSSVGIGKAISKALVECGLKVVGCARNIDQLKQLESDLNANKTKGSFKAIKCDLRQESEIKSMFDEIRSTFGRIDICINNAGLAKDAPIIDGNTEFWREMLDVNVTALSICTREAISLMRDNDINDGHIIHLSSLSGHRLVPSSATHFYGATKYAVRALAEGLRQELRAIKSGIRVTLISPGVVETEFSVRLQNIKEKNIDPYANNPHVKAEDISQIVVNVLQMPPHVEINDVLIRPTFQLL